MAAGTAERQGVAVELVAEVGRHRISLRSWTEGYYAGRPAYRAECSCGLMYLMTESIPNAQRDAREHVVEAEAEKRNQAWDRAAAREVLRYVVALEDALGVEGRDVIPGDLRVSAYASLRALAGGQELPEA